jgi:prophage regulatory protein
MVNADRIVRERERREITGISRTTAFVLERKGLFPQRVVVTGNRVGWRLSELEAWVQSRPPVVAVGVAA